MNSNAAKARLVKSASNKFFCNMEVFKNIATVYGDKMAAFVSFFVASFALSLYYVALCYR